MMEQTNRSVVVFGGPSLPRPFKLVGVDVRRPAVRGDFGDLIGNPDLVVVLLDGGFLQEGAITHFELGALLMGHSVLVGAASTGALRAAELDSHGMIGMGTVYRAILEGIVIDDSELAVGVSPTTYQALTIPLINIRRLLFQAVKAGMSRPTVDEAWRLAADIYFLSRTPATLLEAWNNNSTREIARMFETTSISSWNVKEKDAVAAIRYAQRLVAGEHLLPGSSSLDLLTNRISL